MNNWKHYAGSVLLAGLLLQGCSDASKGDSQDQGVKLTKSDVSSADKFQASSSAFAGASEADRAQAESDLTVKLAVLASEDEEMQAYIEQIKSENGLESDMEVYKALAAAITNNAPTKSSARRGVFSKIGDKLKDGLVDIMDTKLGDKITGAAFDVVLNSEGVTVVMLDLARKSQTVTDIMINALEENWGLTVKMCPMLQTNSEFGEKFVALADERDNLGRFFFEKIDATMYGCLTDAMILSSDNAVHDDSVKYSTTGYMGVLLEKYAADYFIEPGTGSATYKDASTDKFAGLMFTTGNEVTLDGNTTSGHGDANELINEQFFYAMFRTPGSTDAFVAAMDKVKAKSAANVTLFMDEIFLGKNETTAFAADDTIQGYYNIISIAGGMYEGVNKYGFGKYTSAFIGFAKLIPADRYFTYGSQFMSAGYFWAEQNGVNIWGTVADGAKDLYNQYTSTSTTNAPARSAGLGTISSPWISDTLSVVGTAWDDASIFGCLTDNNVFACYQAEGLKAYDTVIGSPTSTATTVLGSGETVKGFHGLLELAIREDMVNVGGMTMAQAEGNFSLPAFDQITWDYAYTSATSGATAYYNNVVDAGWLADLSDADLVREYFYPSAENVYIPSWLMAIDWLKAPQNVGNASIATTDFSFDAGYLDIYVVTPNADLVNEVNLPQAANPVKTITMEAVTMDSDSIIAVDADGTNLDGLYVYKVRVVSPEDTAAVIAYLNSLVDSSLTAIGIDADNAAQTVAVQ